jgi:glycosyltransferase involved in cell wall biosynthesis
MRLMPGYDALAVVTNGVDLKANTGDFGTSKPDTLIYPGALTYVANFDAMEFFLQDILPLVKAQRPNVRLRITGGYDGVPVERLPLGNGAELTGYLDDIRPAVAQSWTCVVPLRVGGGTRLKILEALALGTPVISTSKGAEGLEVTHEENILIADDPESFARAVLRLLGDEALRTKLSVNGRRLVEERYSWEICARQLDQLLDQVVEQAYNSNG